MKSWVVVVAGFMLLLAGCGSGGQEALQDWMAQQRRETKPRVQPISEPKKFTPQAYNQGGALDPYNREKLTQALRKESAQSSQSAALIAPELARRKETLEDFPLDTMRLVGSLVKDGQMVGLLQVDKLLYQVKAGQYLGQNYGRIIKIAETELTLREIVQDAAGEWIERPATLKLQERSK